MLFFVILVFIPFYIFSFCPEQIQSIFGKKMLDYFLNLCQGHYDFLVRMPESLIVYILSFLNTEDTRQFSKTCKRFWQVIIFTTILKEVLAFQITSVIIIFCLEFFLMEVLLETSYQQHLAGLLIVEYFKVR